MGGPHTVVKNPSPDKKSWSENTFVFVVLVRFMISLYLTKYNKIKRNKNNI
jgi:hypothetical protein